MEYLLSALYTVIDAACVLIFLDAFTSRLFIGFKYYLMAAVYTLSLYIVILLNMEVFGYSTTLKMILTILCGTVFGCILYANVSLGQVLFLVVLEYLLTYLLSFMSLYISAIICGVSIPVFRQEEVTPFVISSIIYYFLQVVSVLGLNKIIRSKGKREINIKGNAIKIILYLLFPSASFFMLLILLRITSRQGLSEGAIIVCCWMIFMANAAILYLLDQVKREEQNREKLLALNQQLQMQRKNMEETCNLYSTQRKQVHDFRAHLDMIKQLLDDQQFVAAESYLDSILKQQSERIFLVNCHHAVLNALFNSKASEAIRQNIDVHFEVNDLSGLTIDAIDLTVLLSNLIDNAIEGCKKCAQNRSIQIQANMKASQFSFIIRNTALPVKIINNEIPSTKSSLHLHGFGLSNIKAILNKYCGEYAMSYKDGYFQFIFEIPLNLHL